MPTVISMSFTYLYAPGDMCKSVKKLSLVKAILQTQIILGCAYQSLLVQCEPHKPRILPPVKLLVYEMMSLKHLKRTLITFISPSFLNH